MERAGETVADRNQRALLASHYSIIITNALFYAADLILDEFSTNPELSMGPISDAAFIVRFLTKFLQNFCEYFTFEQTYEPFVTVCQGEGFA